jgi:hypothetical protein
MKTHRSKTRVHPTDAVWSCLTQFKCDSVEQFFKITVFCDLVSCYLVAICQRSRENYNPEAGRNTLLGNIGTCINTSLHLLKQQYS